jgi:hypothetical protein
LLGGETVGARTDAHAAKGRTTVRGPMIVWTMLAALLVGLSALTYSYSGITHTGQLSSAEHEADEGYFNVGQDATTMAKPGTDLHAWLKGHNGQRIRIAIDADTQSQ